MRFRTQAVQIGLNRDTTFNSIITPIYPSSTFRFEDLGKTKGYDYSRTSNPTRKALEESLAALEGGVRAFAVATGMAAITTALHLCKSGDHLISTHDCYGGTERLLRTYGELFGIQTTFVDLRDLAEVRAAFRPNTKAVWIETPSNPLLNITDVQALAALAHEHGALAFVDNTFLSPVNQKPFALGADVIVHSTTKYLNGHSDVVGGAIITNDHALGERLQFLVNALGLGASPFDCWLVLRGIKTLPARMREHEKNARAVVEFLTSHALVERVYYPGLPSHPGHELAKRQQHGFGGMISFEVRGGRAAVDNVLRNVKIFALAESLGGVESLICHPATMTHASMTPARREKAGINERIIRLSIGLEDVQDLIEDLEQAFHRAAAV